MKPSDDNSDIITDIQKRVSFNLVRNIILRNPGIRKAWANEQGGITGHYSISPITRHYCPGPYPFEELFETLNDESGGSGKSSLYTKHKFALMLILTIYIVLSQH